jgi:hypothetical protein
LPHHPDGDALAAFVRALAEDGWQRLLENMPAAIRDGEPADFSERRVVTLEQLRAAARGA